MRNLRNAFVSLGIFVAAIFLTSSSTARSSPWKDKDWTKWTEQDCKRILTDSPWTSQIIVLFANSGPDGPEDSRAVVESSLVVRQALSKLGPEDTCVDEKFDDRIVIHFSEDDLFKTPPDLIVSGRKIPPVPTNNSSHAKEDVGDSPFRSFPHCSQWAFVFRWSYW